MNKPYVKQYELNANDILVMMNPIDKNNPYLHKYRSQRGKSKRLYRHLNNPMTGEYIGKVKVNGNNRANMCSLIRINKNKNSRNMFRN